MKYEKTNWSLVLLLSLIAGILIFIFTIPTAHALQVVTPMRQTTISNTTYYSYDLPTVPNSFDSNKLVIGASYPTSNYKWKLNSIRSLSYEKSQEDTIFGYEVLDNYLTDHNINVSTINKNMTPLIDFAVSGNSSNKLNDVYWAFHLGNQGSTSDMLSTPTTFNYNEYYSYSFDVVLFSEYGGLGYVSTSQDSPVYSTSNGSGLCSLNNPYESILEYCGYNSNYQTFTCYSLLNNNGVDMEVLYSDNKLQIIKVKVLFNSDMKWKFNDGINFDSSDSAERVYGFVGNSSDVGKYYWNNGGLPINSQFPVSTTGKDYRPVLLISEPYDISLWTTESSLYCQSDCWTQSKTDEFTDYSKDETPNSFLSELLDIFNEMSLHDYGFGSIVYQTFNFVIDTLNDLKNSSSCHTYTVTFLQQDIVLPCGRDFWYNSSSDMTNFRNWYEFLFTGIVAYIMCWRIYKDILEVISGSTKIYTGNEVDSL